jgi:FkbM family methyltransferase
MAAFYRKFLAPGDLAFDVGSHAGNRVRAFKRTGARVVAIEPQPDFVTVLKLLYGRDRDVAVEPCAVGREPGEARLYLSTRTPTVSTLAGSWIHEVRRDETFGGVDWDEQVVVPVLTLDEVIDRHGEPRFCKIDVEGYELDVLQGLSRPLGAVSFEYIPVVMDRTVRCVGRLAELGDYRFRFSRVESFEWATPVWMDASGVTELLRRISPRERPGDVYAVRADLPLPAP